MIKGIYDFYMFDSKDDLILARVFNNIMIHD